MCHLIERKAAPLSSLFPWFVRWACYSLFSWERLLVVCLLLLSFVSFSEFLAPKFCKYFPKKHIFLSLWKVFLGVMCLWEVVRYISYRAGSCHCSPFSVGEADAHQAPAHHRSYVCTWRWTAEEAESEQWEVTFESVEKEMRKKCAYISLSVLFIDLNFPHSVSALGLSNEWCVLPTVPRAAQTLTDCS